MKQLLRKSQLILCFFGMALLFYECQNEPVDFENHQIKTSDVKTWFESYQSNLKTHFLFEDLVYHWNEAETVYFPNGTNALKVPATYFNQNPNYIGKKYLYIYPEKNTKSYKVTLYEMFATATTTMNEDINNFTGYIVAWDLSAGFISGARFKNTIWVDDISLRIDYNTPTNLFEKKPYQEPEELKEVVVTGGGSGGKITFTFSDLNIKNAFPQTVTVYISNPRSGGGQSSGNTKNTLPAALVNPCEKLKAKLKDIQLQERIENLRKKTSLQYESGFIENSDGTFTDLKNNDDHSLDMSISTKKTIGFTHSHQDDFEIDTDGEIIPKRPIRMFSPADLKQFHILLMNAYGTKTPLENIYGSMITSSAQYTINYLGAEPTRY